MMLNASQLQTMLLNAAFTCSAFVCARPFLSLAYTDIDSD